MIGVNMTHIDIGEWADVFQGGSWKFVRIFM
jgi:hypothetical protein